MTRRAGHGPSLEQACRHLLLHLDDATKLGSNSLVAGIFERRHHSLKAGTARRQAVDDIRRIVKSAADELKTGASGSDAAHRHRQHQILVRCDLGGEPHKQVALDLGISLRQFYRERRSVRVWLAGFIEKAAERFNKQPAFVFDGFDLALNRAQWLFELGAARESFDALKDLRNSEAEPRKKLAAWTALIEMSARIGESANATREWSHAKAQCSKDVEPWLDVVHGTVLWYSGSESAALRADQRSRRALDGLAKSDDRLGREFALRQCIELLRRMGWTEPPATRAGMFQRAEEIIESIDDPSPILRASLLCELLNFRVVQLGESHLVRPLLDVAFDLTRKYGLHESHALCLLTLSQIEELDGRLRQSTGAVHEYQRLLPGVKTISIKRLLSIRAADVEAQIGCPAACIGTTRSLREGVVNRSHLWVLSTLLEGKLLMELRDYKRAMPLFREVHAASRDSVLSKATEMASTSMRFLATSYAELGRMREAREHIDEALRVLATGDHPIPLRRAQRVAAKIAQLT